MILHLIFILLVLAFHYPLTIKKLLLSVGLSIAGFIAFILFDFPMIFLSMYLAVMFASILDKEISGSYLYQLFILGIFGFITYCVYKQYINENIASIVMMCFYFVAMNNQRTMKKSYEQSMNEYQNTVVSRQVEEVNHLYMTMRGWRHDYHNHLQSLKAYIKKEQYQEAYTYLDDLEDDLDDITQIVTTGNVHVDAILNSKFSLALNQNIQLDFKASVPEKLNISDLDLCVLIGNLVDNAVESCLKIDEDKRFIRFYMGTYKKQFYISMTNATGEIIRKLDEEYITTKRGNHGHGLKRINLVVEKNNGMINRKNEPGVFVTEVMIPLLD